MNFHFTEEEERLINQIHEFAVNEVAPLAAELDETFDADRRAELAVEMQQIILDDNAFVFCSHLQMSMISQSDVTGLVAHPCDFYEITVDLRPAE